MYVYFFDFTKMERRVTREKQEPRLLSRKNILESSNLLFRFTLCDERQSPARSICKRNIVPLIEFLKECSFVDGIILK